MNVSTKPLTSYDAAVTEATANFGPAWWQVCQIRYSFLTGYYSIRWQSPTSKLNR